MQIDPSSKPAAPASSKTAVPAPLTSATPPAAPAPAGVPADKARFENPGGKALASIALGGAGVKEAPALKLLGIKQGDKLEVDGATTADGSATVKTLNDGAPELQAAINIPYLARGLADDAFALVDGKVNLSIKLTREGDKHRFQLIDNNAKGAIKGSGLSKLVSSEGTRTEKGFWGGSEQIKTQTLSIDTEQGALKISLQQDAKGKVTGTVTIPGLPGMLNSFDLEKR